MATLELDADSKAFLDMLKASGRPPLNALPPLEAREVFRRGRLVTQPELPHVDRVYERSAAGPHGPIPLRVYRGAGTADMGPLPVHVYYHGGGWVIGDLDSHDWVCRKIANAAQCAVVSVDYRMAPEHVFPASFDDALAAARWVAENASALRIDPARVSVGGDSAGGNLAAAVAIAARDEDGPRLRAQILVYPAVDLAMTGDYYGRFTEGLALTDDVMRWFIDLYVPDKAQRADWRASPLLAKSLRGLPPAFVLTAGFDPLCAEGLAYAARLTAEGVPVTTPPIPARSMAFCRTPSCCPRPTTRSMRSRPLSRPHSVDARVLPGG